MARMSSMRQLSISVARTLTEGQDAAVRAALVKDLGTRFEQDSVEVTADLLEHVDAGSPEAARLRALLDTARVHSPLFTLRGGTNEVLRGVVAKNLGKGAAGAPTGRTEPTRRRRRTPVVRNRRRSSWPSERVRRAAVEHARRHRVESTDHHPRGRSSRIGRRARRARTLGRRRACGRNRRAGSVVGRTGGTRRTRHGTTDCRRGRRGVVRRPDHWHGDATCHGRARVRCCWPHARES